MHARNRRFASEREHEGVNRDRPLQHIRFPLGNKNFTTVLYQVTLIASHLPLAGELEGWKKRKKKGANQDAK